MKKEMIRTSEIVYKADSSTSGDPYSQAERVSNTHYPLGHIFFLAWPTRTI